MDMQLARFWFWIQGVPVLVQNFAITQILRETNIGGSRSAKSAIWTNLQALNFDFVEFLHLLTLNLPNEQNLKPQK